MRYLIYWLVIVVVCSSLLIVGLGFYLSPQNELAKSDAIVVISGGETEERIREGVQLFQDEWAPLIIMSGAARDEGISNALMMKQMAVNLGILASNIIAEENAQTTWENAKYVADIVASKDINSIILVTSPYHQRRAYLNFCHFLGSDFKIVNHSAKDSAWRKNGWWSSSWARYLTFTELQKNIYSNWLFATKDAQKDVY